MIGSSPIPVGEAQRELREAFLGGAVGQGVAALLWWMSAALSTVIGPRQGIWFLLIAGAFIYPLTQLGCRALGRAGRVGAGNPHGALGFEVALVLPLSLPVVGAAALYRTDWFYPAFMLALGAHYLPFAHLYGMRIYRVLAALLWGAGLVIGLWYPLGFAGGAWVAGGLLAVFALWAGSAVLTEEAGARRNAQPPPP